MKLTPIHPFPARMAPEIVIRELEGLSTHRTILDPMTGSGTVLRAAAELGHRAIGYDIDPLAVLMARVWTTPFRVAQLSAAADELVLEAKAARSVRLPWIDECEETRRYVNFWFGRKQKEALRHLSFALARRSGPLADAMRVALSRIIITKERGASVARDCSHSRPHRVFFENDYDVYKGFLRSAGQLTERLTPQRLLTSVAVKRGDARRLSGLPPNSVDVAITSPPYLNAIDYLRGHRLSLVWFGYGLPALRSLRAASIGSERSAKITASELERLLPEAGDVDKLPPREFGMLRRYAQDVYGFVSELARVVKKGGRVLLVVGNSCLKGVPLCNADINVAAAKMLGLQVVRRSERPLPPSRRYLPTPLPKKSGTLDRRMNCETLLAFSVH